MNADPLTQSETAAIRAAVDAAGSQAALARLVGVSQPTVWRWVRGRAPLSPELVLKVEEATGISRHALRPDLYPTSPDAAGDRHNGVRA